MTQEHWAPVAGTNGAYEVSTRGRVRSLDRFVFHARHRRRVKYKGKVLSCGKVNTDGYHIVVLKFGARFKSVTVHRLVAAAFVPNPKADPMVRHLDENPRNNFVENLAWGTARDNYRDMCCWQCGAPYKLRPRRTKRGGRK